MTKKTRDRNGSDRNGSDRIGQTEKSCTRRDRLQWLTCSVTLGGSPPDSVIQCSSRV